MKKWIILKIVWNIAIFTLLVWITVQNNLSHKILNLGFYLVTDNQKIIENKLIQHNKDSCKEIKL